MIGAPDAWWSQPLETVWHMEESSIKENITNAEEKSQTKTSTAASTSRERSRMKG